MPDARTNRTRLDNLLFYVVVALLAYFVFSIFEPFLAPLGWAGVMVVVFYPFQKRLERRMPPGRAALVSTLGVTLILIVPVLALVTLSVHEAAGVVHAIAPSFGTGWPTLTDLSNFSGVTDLSSLPGPIGRAGAWLDSKFPAQHAVNIVAMVQRAVVYGASFLGSKLGSIFRNAIVFVFDLFVTLFALFYIFRDADWIVANFRRLLPFSPAARERILSQARELINASVTTSLVIAAIYGVVGGISFAVLGLGAPIFWGAVMAFLSMLPVVGAWPVWLPATIYLFASGHWERAIVLLAIALVVIGTTDYVVRPIMVGKCSELSGLVVFISVLGGVAVFGPLGLVLGPIVVATATSLFTAASHSSASSPPGEGPAVAHTS
ncbi:MAG: AI-2E family transporter [Candidatus Acidiferrales bacterium]